MKQVLALVGPKGAGKSTIGDLLASAAGIHFLRVEPIFLAIRARVGPSHPEYEALGFQAVFRSILEALARHDVVCFETTGASDRVPWLLSELRAHARVLPVRILVPPEECLLRVQSRDASIHIPVSDDQVARINAVAARVVLPWAAEIDNSGPLDGPAIVATVRGLLCGRLAAEGMKVGDDVERIRRALLEAALQAHDDAGLRGLCAEGRWEAAVSALRSLDLPAALREPPGEPGDRPAIPPPARPEPAGPAANVVNLKAALERFSTYWDPKIVGELNGQQVKLVKFRGPFVWHRHEAEDELFLVLHGAFTMELRDRSLRVREGELLVVPRGTEHRPVADEEVHVLLFEPASTLNTGDTEGPLTVRHLERL